MVRHWLDRFSRDFHADEFAEDGSNPAEKTHIRSQIGTRGGETLESIFDYTIDLSAKGRAQSFESEVALYFPPQMGVHRHNTSPESFYRLLTPRVRLREPSYSFKDFMGTSRRRLPSPFFLVAQALMAYQAASRPKRRRALRQRVVNLIRISATSYASYAMRRVARRRRRLLAILNDPNLSEAQQVAALDRLIEGFPAFVGRNISILKSFFSVLVRVPAGSRRESDKIKHEMEYAREYCFHKFYELVTHLTVLLHATKPHASAECFARVRKATQVWQRGSRMFSRHHGYRLLEADSSSAHKEAVIDRMSFLKQRLWQVYYLESRGKGAGRLQIQLSHMMAAGFAAVWAFVANLFVLRFLLESQIGQSADWMSSTLGVGGLIGLGVSVFAYILKDRIKEVGRSNLYALLFGDPDDFDERVWQTQYDGSTKVIGRLRERMRFFDSSKRLDPKFRQMRFAAFAQQPTAGETVLHYCKRLTVRPSKTGFRDVPVLALRDILRLDLSDFTHQLPESVREQWSLSVGQEPQLIEVPRVFYVDMVVRHEYRVLGQTAQTSYHCQRIVMNKNGVLRLDPPNDALFRAE